MSEHKFLEHLIEDHGEQKRIGKQLTETREPQVREQLRNQYYRSLYPHIIGEEASIFPRLKKADEEARDASLEGLQEHHVAKMVLRELMELQTNSEVFKAKAKVLDELNRHHIEEEESEIFDHLKRVCSDREIDQLFEKYEKAEEEAKKQ